MKPVLVIRHAKTEGAGFFGAFLDQHNIPWEIKSIDKGDAIPNDISVFSGLVMMGGPMSVNDDLPWIADEVALIQQAMAKNVPILGHCLGGQLISKALGATVKANPVKEIGWGEVRVSDEQGLKLFGTASFESFHWHGETFELPEGAQHLLSSEYCQNQAYLMANALAFQCHIEMTEQMVKTWCENGGEELDSYCAIPSVQQPEVIQKNLEERVANLNNVARNVYAYWTGLLHSS
jgi:GMP synthase-like glutamine amidotransferase